MVLVPAGAFLFGERNQRASLGAFYIDMFEVTTQLYSAFLKATGHREPEHWDEVRADNDGQLPVIGVEWSDADTFCRFYKKRLPTDEEWENEVMSPQFLCRIVR